MTDDIVTRLRRVTEIKRYNDFSQEVEIVATFTTNSDAREAADEIERLRAEIAELKNPLKVQPVKSEFSRWLH